MMDLLNIKEMYKKIINDMNNNGIEIWDDIYPCEFFADDISNSRLHILTNEKGDILGAFVLCNSNVG